MRFENYHLFVCQCYLLSYELPVAVLLLHYRLKWTNWLDGCQGEYKLDKMHGRGGATTPRSA